MRRYVGSVCTVDLYGQFVFSICMFDVDLLVDLYWRF